MQRLKLRVEFEYVHVNDQVMHKTFISFRTIDAKLSVLTENEIHPEEPDSRKVFFPQHSVKIKLKC